MFSRNLLVVAVSICALGGSLSAGGQAAKVGTGTGITLRIPDEGAPAGAMVQMKVETTEVTPISGGRPSFDFSGTFDAAAGFAIAAPNGEVAGAAVVNGSHVQIFYEGTSLLTANYPILTTVLHVRADAPVASQTQFTIDPTSLWNFSTTGPTTATISPGTVTVLGSDGVAINDVVPGEGVWPAGTIVSVRGAGFTAKTKLKVNDAGVKDYAVVSPTEIQFVLPQPTEIRGLRIIVSGRVNSTTYYAYMRGITARLSARPLLAMTEPIFSVAQRTVATFGPIPQLAGNQYQAVALQNPTFGDVAVGIALYGSDGTLIHQSSTTLAGRNRVALELSELLDGVAPPAGSSVVVTASAPIDAIGLLCDEGAGTIVPTLPL
jgi:IPT/TIG domain-containing protein